MLKIAIVQMSSTNDLNANYEKMEHYIARAAKERAHLIAFPEMAYFVGQEAEWRQHLESYQDSLDQFSEWARQYGIYLVSGSLREPVKGNEEKYFNTLTLHGPNGNLLSKYRKLFLFRADLSDRSYRESDHCEPGNMVVVKEGAPAALGFGICFDLRFPELFRAQKKEGAQLILLPSAFTVPTGKDHWRPLIQARAIENQVFIAAPAQVGKLGDGRECYGHSMVVDPWGTILGELSQEEGLLLQEIDLQRIKTASDKIDVWASRRTDLFK